MAEETTVEIKTQSDIIAARHAGREAAHLLGFGLADQTRLATAISELARNVIQYAGTGVCTIFANCAPDPSRPTIRVVVEDRGPGIPDLDRAMKPGFSTGRGLGAGLPGAKRLVDEFHIQSGPGHTKVAMKMTRRRM